MEAEKMTPKDLTPEEFEAFVQSALRVARSEHEQMPRFCPRCGGRMIFKLQRLVMEPPGDVLIYVCEVCGEEVSKFFPFPEDHAKYFK
ncbi:MAG: zinc ribbon domain-containing protein [Candidatus Freyarchaeota archaeon]|nr:zinc ribbon domain-containing protein [Candidatus Jordarchaeia archaeon]